MNYHRQFAPDCTCDYPELPHLVSQAAALREAANVSAGRKRNADGTFMSKNEEAWQAIPDAQKKLLGYRKPRKAKKK